MTGSPSSLAILYALILGGIVFLSLFVMMIELPALRSYSTLVIACTCALLGFAATLMDPERRLLMSFAAAAATIGYLLIVGVVYTANGEDGSAPLMQAVSGILATVGGAYAGSKFRSRGSSN